MKPLSGVTCVLFVPLMGQIPPQAKSRGILTAGRLPGWAEFPLTPKLSSRLTREEALKFDETSFAWPVCCSTLFGVWGLGLEVAEEPL